MYICILWYTVGKLNIYDSQLVSSQGWLDRFVFLGLRRHGNRPHQTKSQPKILSSPFRPFIRLSSSVASISVYIRIQVVFRDTVLHPPIVSR